MRITKKEITRISGLIFLFTGIGLIVPTIQRVLNDSFNPLWAGLIIIGIGAWLFNYEI